MSNSWMYDGFPLKRADGDTRGDDYQFVIQSIDAALRHAFGFPTGVSLTPAFSINANGEVEILQSLAIGSALTITEVVDFIPVYATADDAHHLANVDAIRTFTLEFIDSYLSVQDVFVLKTGDTMSGQLIAEGGITAAADLNIENALFSNSPRLPDRIPLVSGGRGLIRWDDAVVIGDPTGALTLVGAGARPNYRSEAIAFVSDIVAAVGGSGIDYVPEMGGTFTGLVNFDAGLMFPAAVGPSFEWNAGGSAFTLAYVFNDATGEVEVGAPGGIRVADQLMIDDEIQLKIGGSWRTAFEFDATRVNVGATQAPVNLKGSAARPLYNLQEIAMMTDVGDALVEGDGISIVNVGPNVSEVGITPGGMTATFFPASDPGYYLRLEPVTGDLIWDDLAVLAGTGLVATTNPLDRAVTLNIDDQGVNTTQLAPGACDISILADDAVSHTKILADRNDLIPDQEFSLVYLNGDLEWHKGGAGAIVSTREYETITMSSTYGAITIRERTNGPYMITSIEVDNASSFRSGSLRCYVEGELVKTFGIPSSSNNLVVLSGDAVPILAAREFKFEIESNPDALNFGVSASINIIRFQQ